MYFAITMAQLPDFPGSSMGPIWSFLPQPFSTTSLIFLCSPESFPSMKRSSLRVYKTITGSHSPPAPAPLDSVLPCTIFPNTFLYFCLYSL